MFVRALVVAGFCNLQGCIPLAEPLAVLLGENNAGKSSVIDALRILFTPEAGPRGRKWITEQDFHHDATGTPTTDVLELEAQLGGLATEEQARMVTCLAPSLGAGSARLRLRASRRPTGKIDVEWFGGDSQHAEVEAWARESVVFTYFAGIARCRRGPSSRPRQPAGWTARGSGSGWSRRQGRDREDHYRGQPGAEPGRGDR